MFCLIFVLKRQEDKIDPVRSNFGKIEKDEIDMDAKMVYIEDYVRSHRTFSFRNLLEKQHSKVEIIVTFMVILEMMKLGRIGIVQEGASRDRGNSVCHGGICGDFQTGRCH